MIRVYAIKLIENHDFSKIKDSLLSELPSSSKNKIEAFKKTSDLQRSLIGEYFTRKVLSEKNHIPLNEIEIKKTEKGKPYTTANTDSHFNISHSGKWVVVVFSEQEIGIDIEYIRPVNFQIAKRFFSAEEYASLISKKGQNKLEFFFDLWTLKESYLKLLGKGLTKPLSSFTIQQSNSDFKILNDKTDYQSVFFKQYQIDKEYKLSVCSLSSEFDDKLEVLSCSELI